VYERHIPEIALVADPDLVQVGSLVRPKQEIDKPKNYRVVGVDDDRVRIAADGNGSEAEVSVSDLFVVKPFGEPIYPTLTPLETLSQSSDRPYHAVINGENFHALQLLAYLYEGKVDCIYLDPPYNTGARDWKYNNRYVDGNDSYRHSKWLSMIEKRLRIAKRLLKPDGVLIVTIDENEVHHLGVLLEELFPEYLRYLVTIVISARGNFKRNFSRVEEYAVFCCPDTGEDVITGAPIDYLPSSGDIDFDPWEDEDDDPDLVADTDIEVEGEGEVELRHARRRGPDSRREDRWTMFYPIYIDEQDRRVVRVGEAPSEDSSPDFSLVDGLRPVWPIDSKGIERRWRWGADRMAVGIASGDVVLGKHNKKRDSWTINLRIPKVRRKNIKTVWRRAAYDAGTYGTSLLEEFLGASRLFSFPKSVYATRDCLAAVCRDRPDALIVDAFGGSGTTLHSTLLMNEADQGRRRCIIVTNNEVSEDAALRLQEDDLHPGDQEYESSGIFESVARPRVRAAISGRRPDGEPVPGKYLNGRAHAQGFEENVEFFRLDYLNPDRVELGAAFDAIHPLLWLAAGGRGPRPSTTDISQPFFIQDEGGYAVLFDVAALRDLELELGHRSNISHVYVITDSPDAYAEARALVGQGRETAMLYRDYLRNFRINTPRNV